MFPSPTPSWILISCNVIRGPIWRNKRAESFLPWGCQRKPPLPLDLTSVRRMALCWARMLPRPAMAWGSSVMLCSPSGSASLSDSPAPLCEGHTAHQGISGSWDSSGIPWTMAASYPTPPHVASSSLMSCRRLMLGNFSWRSFFIPRLAPTGTTLMLL